MLCIIAIAENVVCDDIEYHTYSTEFKLVYGSGSLHAPLIIDLGESFQVCNTSYDMQFSELLSDHEITKLPDSENFQRVVSFDKQSYRLTRFNSRKRRFVFVAIAGIAVAGMLFWSVYTAHDAKRMAMENQHLLSTTKIAVVDLERDMNAKIVLIEKRLNDALDKMDQSICHMSESLARLMAVQSLNHRFDRLIDTLLSGRLNTAILPLSSVRRFISSYPELQHSLYSRHPQLLYELADVEVISDDLHETSIMRGVIKVPNLLHAYENVSMHFIFTNSSIFGPIYLGVSSNKTMDECRAATHNHELMICPGFRVGTHKLQRIDAPVVVINGLVVVNHDILVQVDPGKELPPHSPFMRKGPFIIDRLQAKSVAYNLSIWFLEPTSFKVSSQKLNLEIAKVSIPILSSDWTHANNIVDTLEDDFKSHEVSILDPLKDMDNEVNASFDSVASTISKIWDFICSMYGAVAILITLIIIGVIIKYITWMRSLCKSLCCCLSCINSERKTPKGDVMPIRVINSTFTDTDCEDNISLSPLEALRIMRSSRTRQPAITQS